MTEYKILFFALIIIFVVGCAVGFHAGHMRAVEAFEKEKEVENAEGGAEIEVEEPNPTFTEGFQFLFPIHEEDFLFYSSAYGMRVSPILGVERKHTGVDICGVWRSQIVSIADGVVIEHWPPPDGHFRGHRVHGGYVVVEHEDGVQSHYSHMSWTRVRTGRTIKAGEVIGRIGRTGQATGNHLHFELHINGEPVNPLLYIPNPLEINYRDWY